MRLALGSQESCSQGAAGMGRLQSQRSAAASGSPGATFGGPTPAPSPAGGALVPAPQACVAAEAAAQLERLQLGQVGEEAAQGAGAGQAAEAGAMDAAMQVAGQIAEDLAG